MPKKILIINDRKVLAAQLSDMLKRVGHEVRVVPNAALANAVMTEAQFDVVITEREIGGDQEAGLKIVSQAHENGITGIIMIADGPDALMPVTRKSLQRLGEHTHFIEKSDMRWVPKLLAVLNEQVPA